MAASIIAWLDAVLAAPLAGPAGLWLGERCAEVADGANERELALAFALIARRCPAQALSCAAAQRQQAAELIPGWQAEGWMVADAARARLLLAIPAAGAVARIQRLYPASSLAELVSLYRALPLYPAPEAWRTRAAEGIRTSATPVFEAVALDNPYPAAWLDEDAWNQMVIKAVFTGSALVRVVGLRQRSNPTLQQMLSDLVRERRAASRPVAEDVLKFLADAPMPDDS